MSDYTAQDGKVFIRGIYRTADECERLLAVYRQQADIKDWWAPFAADLANQLEAAMRAAATEHSREAA